MFPAEPTNMPKTLGKCILPGGGRGSLCAGPSAYGLGPESAGNAQAWTMDPGAL